MGNYLARWRKRAFTGSLGAADLLIGLLGAVAAIAAHFLRPSQAIMTGLEWQIPFWGFAAVVIGRIVAAPFLLAKEDAAKIAGLEKRIAELEDEYPHSLRLGQIDYNLAVNYSRLKNGKRGTAVLGRAMGFTLHLINTLERPVEYRFKRIAINSVDTDLGSAGEVIAPKTSTVFRTALLPTALKVAGSPENFTIGLEYSYGEPGKLTRCVVKNINLSIFHDTKRTDYGYSANEETQCL